MTEVREQRDPLPVQVDEPIRVTVDAGPMPNDTHAERERTTRAAAEVTAGAKESAGQRRVNLIWEGTQSAIALSVVLTTCIGIFLARIAIGVPGAFPPEWWTIVGLVIGFYFGRTNHTRTGGVGRSADGKER